MQNVLYLVEVVPVVDSSRHLREHLVVGAADTQGTALAAHVKWLRHRA